MSVEQKTISFQYVNHRGETQRRTVSPIKLHRIEKPGYNYAPGWFLTGYCHDRKAIRSFALDAVIGDPNQVLMTFNNMSTTPVGDTNG